MWGCVVGKQCPISVLSCILSPGLYELICSKLLKMNGHGKLCGWCPVSTGRPSSARTPRAKHCLSVLLYSMALLQQSFRSYFIFHEKCRCTHRRSRQNLRASVHWLVEFKVCRGLKMCTDYVSECSAFIQPCLVNLLLVRKIWNTGNGTVRRLFEAIFVGPISVLSPYKCEDVLMLGNSEGTFMRDEALALTLKIWPRATFPSGFSFR